MSEDLYTEDLGDNDVEIIEENDGIEPIQEVQDDEDQTNVKPVKPKRIVRNPQPKLNEETLKGPRGLTALPSYFERVKFKGKGHEEEDLNVLLKTYEYWCHRLFPKFPFDDCIAKIEKLGTKRAVQTHIKRIRMGVELPEESTVINNDNDEDQQQLVENDDSFTQLMETPTTSVGISDEQEERIRLNRERARKLREEKLKTIQQQNRELVDNQVSESEFSQETAGDKEKTIESSNNKVDDDGEESIEHILDQINADDTVINNDNDNDQQQEQLVENHDSFTQLMETPTTSVGISDEQEERIRLNRERARKLREEKLKTIQQQNRELVDNQISESEISQATAMEMVDDKKNTIESSNNKVDDDDGEESIEDILDQINADDA